MADGQAEAAPLLMAVEGGVATLTLNRPKKLNALSEGLLGALLAALSELRETRRVKAVVLRASGKHFCAGHDLGELTARRADADKGAAYFTELFQLCAQVMTGVVRLPQPVIAQTHGIAAAAGCQLVASCDLAVATDTARFMTPGVDIGLFCSTPMVALSRNVSRKHAMEMLLTGAQISATRAEAMGLVNRVVPEDELEETARALAELIASKSPKAVKIGKPAFYAQAEMELDAAYAYTARVMAENMLERDAEEGIGAFIEKRAPEWPEEG